MRTETDIDEETFQVIINQENDISSHRNEKAIIQESLNNHINEHLLNIERIPLVNDDVRLNWLKENASNLTYYIRQYTKYYTFNSSITLIEDRDQIVAKAFLYSPCILNGDIVDSETIEANELRVMIPTFLALFIHRRIKTSQQTCHITQLYLMYLSWLDPYQKLYRKLINTKQMIYNGVELLKSKRDAYNELNVKLVDFTDNINDTIENTIDTYENELQILYQLSDVKREINDITEKLLYLHAEICRCYSLFIQFSGTEVKLTNFTFEIEKYCVMDMESGLYRILNKKDGTVIFYYECHKHLWIRYNLKRSISPTKFLQDESECCVCYEEITEEPLSCGHRIHRSCIHKSLKTTCPMCRSEVYLKPEELSILYDDILRQ